MAETIFWVSSHSEKVGLTTFSVSLASSELFQAPPPTHQTDCVSLTWKHDVKKPKLMTTSMTAANPGGQTSCCLMLWWTAVGWHGSWLRRHRPGQLLTLLTDSCRKKKMRQMTDFKQPPFIKCLHQMNQYSWKAHIQTHSPPFVCDVWRKGFTQIIPVLHKSCS